METLQLFFHSGTFTEYNAAVAKPAAPIMLLRMWDRCLTLQMERETEAIMGGQVLEYEAKTILNQGKAETKNEDIKSLAEYFVKETPTLSYEDAVKMAESILNK